METHDLPLNFRVFKCNDKRPAVAHWKEDWQYAAYCEDWDNWSSYGILVDNFAVIDFDEDKSRDVFPEGVLHHFCAVDGTSVEELANSGWLLKTPHGYHLPVKQDAAIDQSQGFPLPDGRNSHIDVRANSKGYIIGPGSVTSSGSYEPVAGWDAWARAGMQEMLDLKVVLPSVYAIVAKQQEGIDLRGVKKAAAYDGRNNWTPINFEAGLEQLRSAPEGQAHNILCGCCRFVWRYRNHANYQQKLEQLRDAAARRNIPSTEVENAIRDFIEAKRDKARDAPGADTGEEDYERTAKGEIKDCERNIRLAMLRGAIKTDDMVIDAGGRLVHLPTREEGYGLEYIETESEDIMVDRIDHFLGGSTLTRSKWLPVVAKDIGKNASEKLAPAFIDAIKDEDGEIVTLDEMVNHMSIAGDKKQARRWLEVCLLQALRRILQPAAPLNNILILWGGQGTHKSTFIPAFFDPSYLDPETGKVAHDWSYTDTINEDLKDEQKVGQRLCGKFCIEIPELTAFRRTKDIGLIRDVITRTHDSYRAPYARKQVKQPRTNTFVGTSNEPPTFADQHGVRRFCPLHIVGMIDTSWIHANRVAIWRGLYRTLTTSPQAVVLSPEENEAKERALEASVFAGIPYFYAICDAIRYVTESCSNEKLKISDVMERLTSDQEGPRLHNTPSLQTSLEDVLRHLGSSRKQGRYPTFNFGKEQRDKLAAWYAETSDDVSMQDDKDLRIKAQEERITELTAENERLRAEIKRMRASMLQPEWKGF